MAGIIVVVLSVCVLVAYAVSPPEPKNVCCEPGQYSGILGVYTIAASPGHATVSSESLGNFSMDLQHGRTYSHEFVFRNEFIIIQDYNQGKYWSIINGNCTTYKLPDKQPEKCFLEDEHLDVPLNLGTDLPVHLFHEFNPLRPDIEISTIVRASDCIPLIEESNARTGNTTVVTTVIYTNVTLGVPDMSVFTPPSSCPTTAIDLGNGNAGHNEPLGPSHWTQGEKRDFARFDAGRDWKRCDCLRNTNLGRAFGFSVS